MKKNIHKEKKYRRTTMLIGLCWLVYTCSYLGKLGYSANITQIESAYGVCHSTAGMVNTFFFFAYGVGQIINGLFCKKYNLRFFVFGSLIVSGIMNVLAGCSFSFSLIKYFWLINGFVLSVLWPSLIRLLSETLKKEIIGKAVVIMGTTVATGTFFVYGLSALFVATGSYITMFYVAGALLPGIAVIWFLAYPHLAKKDNTIDDETTEEPIADKKRYGTKGLWIPIGILAFFAVFDNLVKDGLTTWVPMILKEIYTLPDYLSILLTLVLPVLSIFGTMVAVTLHKKVKDFIMLCALLFFCAALFIGTVIICLPSGLLIVTLGCFGIVACLMSGINNVVTSMVPLYWKNQVNSGKLAGVLNGCCYLGSTLSAYGLGVIADAGGWTAVFWLLLILCVAAVIIAALYGLFHRKNDFGRRKLS